MTFLKFSALAGALMIAGAAQAQVGITADAGTTGAGVHVVIPMETYLNGRFGANYFTHDFNKTSNGVDYAIKGKLQTFDILFDWYVREGSPFHVTGGLVYNGNSFKVKAQASQNGTLTLNGHAYTAADIGVVDGNVDFRKAAPYLGIGWGNALQAGSGWGAGHWSFNADLGAFFQGNANLKLGNTGCTVGKAICDAVAADVAAERLHLQDDISSFKVYPVVRASLNYRF
jgi:hypothetical protein